MQKQLLALGSVALGVIVVGSVAVGQGGGGSSSGVSGADRMAAAGPGGPNELCPHKRFKGAMTEGGHFDFMYPAEGRFATPEEAVRRFVEKHRVPHDKIEDRGEGAWRAINNGRNEAAVHVIEQPLGGYDVSSYAFCSTRLERLSGGQKPRPTTNTGPSTSTPGH